MMNKLLSKQGLIILTGVLVVLNSFGCQPNLAIQSESDKRLLIATMYEKQAKEFPQVKGIRVEDLRQLRQQGKNVVLVDVRPLKERKVSIIPGAISSEEFEANLEQYRDSEAKIVVYCTIGYRSGKYARELKERGTNVFNLEGSLLAWSHIQGELVNDSGFTNKVHVFSPKWQLTGDNYEPVW